MPVRRGKKGREGNRRMKVGWRALLAECERGTLRGIGVMGFAGIAVQTR